METRPFCSKTLRSDAPSPSESFLSQENLDGLSPVLPSMADSLSGSSPVSQMALDSLDIQTLIEDVIDEGTVANPRLSESLSTNDVFSLTSPPPSPSSTDSEPSQPLALVPYDPQKPVNYQEKEEDPCRWDFSNCSSSDKGRNMASDQFYSRRENEFRDPGYGYSAWAPWSSRPLSPPKEASRNGREPTGVGAGLENLGNTCFINAVLQCFTHTVPFVLGLRSLNHEKPCARSVESFCLLCALHDHIELSLNSSGGIVSPSKIFDNLNYISSFLYRYEQEDAHEFLQCLLDRLGSCCSDSKPKNNCLSSSDDCLVKKVFGGRLVSQLCCCNCGYISYSYEPLNDLSLEIENVDTLPSALESFTKVEKIEDQGAKFRCENCKEEVAVEKQLMLDQAPSVATFHLKRFKTESGYVEKIDKHVFFPLELDLQPYTIVNQSSNEELKYQLYAVVKHSGFTPTSGHYVSYIRSSPNTWHKLNDSRVTRVEEEVVLSQEAYILFYARRGIPWFSTAIEVQKPCADPGISDSSPKSVLDNMEMECPSDPHVKSRADCGANESKDIPARTSTQFSGETHHEVEADNLHVAVEGISGSPPNESEFHVSKSIDFIDDNPMTSASMPPGPSSCSDGFDKNISNVSHHGENNCNQGVDEVPNNNSLPLMPSRSLRLDKCQRDSSECVPRSHLKDENRGIHRRAVNRTAVDQGRTEAMRYAKRMPTARGAKFMALLAPQTVGKMKKKAGSSSCKRVSPRCRNNHSLMHPVPVSR
ncbi:hypothetical protein POUND7_004858 [Theobroma cacao]